jgi:hypothetical protein
MMELIKLRYRKINIFFIFLILGSTSCQDKSKTCYLENILDNIGVNLEATTLIIGQGDGWTDSTTLVSMILDDDNKYISTNMMKYKGHYNGINIYFNQINIDSMDSKKYISIPSKINWIDNNDLYVIDENEISPPHESTKIEIEYNLKKKCIIEIIRGKELLKENQLFDCMCY